MCRQFTEGLGDFQHGKVLQEIHQQVPLGVGRHQDQQGRITAGNQGFNVDAVIRTEGLFCQNDDWITHGPSLVALVLTCIVVSRGTLACLYRPGRAPETPPMPWSGCGSVRMVPWHPPCASARTSARPLPAGPAARSRGRSRTARGAARRRDVRQRQMGGGRHHRRQRRRRPARRRVLRPRPVLRPPRHHPRPVPGGGPGSAGRHPRGHGRCRSSSPPPRTTTVEGVYGFFFDGGRGHARIGRILSYSPAERTVLREVEAVYSGDLATARRGWWSGAAYPDPAAVGLAGGGRADRRRRRDRAGLAGPRRAGGAERRRLGHHGARPRGHPAGRPAGRPDRPGTGHVQPADLLPQRRPGARRRSDGRYGLGSTEWRDVEAAIGYALARAPGRWSCSAGRWAARSASRPPTFRGTAT